MAYTFNPFTGTLDKTSEASGGTNGGVPDPLTLERLTVTGLLEANHIHGNIAGTVYIHVKNLDNVPLAKGTPFYISGTVGTSDRVEVKAADASDPSKGPAVGLIEETLAVNGEGNGVLLGEIFQYNTLDAGWATNDALYIATGGGLTNTQPTSGFRQVVGYAGRIHDQTGTIVVVNNAADPVAGSNTQIQFNDNGGFGASSNFTFDGFRVLASAISYFNRRPPLHRGPLFYKTAATAISITAGSVLNGVVYDTATAVTMPGSFTNNTDYAIWQHPTTGALVADASFTSAPAGATGGSIVGGFHHIPSGRPRGFNGIVPNPSVEILEYSIWDLTWRPTCPDPRGMTCVDKRFWCDIYFCGSTSYAGSGFTAVPSSKIGLTIADANNPPLIPAIYGGNGTATYSYIDGKGPGSWYDFAEVASSFGKRLISWLELQHAAFGGLERNSRSGDPGTVIWERASLWGLAQSTGTIWSWGSDVQGNTTSSWADGDTGNRGKVFHSGYSAVALGGRWGYETTSGSRSAHWGYAPQDAYDFISARFAADHLVLG